MKKIISILFVLLVNSNILASNPIAPPWVNISELKFEEDGSWTLEIGNPYENIYKNDYDSICIETTSGFSRIRLDNIADTTAVFVVTSDSLLNPLTISSNGDSVSIHSYLSAKYWNEHFTRSLIFGNYPGSVIDTLPSGYSITLWDVYCKDRNPTIGLPNDTAGICGMLKGHIYDKNNRLVTGGIFHLDNTFSILNDSTYVTNIYSRKVVFNRIFFSPGLQMPAYLDIDTIELNVNPGILYEKDIHILDDFTEVEENVNKPNYKINIVNYPNPFNSRTNFAVTIPSSLKYRQKQINIYNTVGQKINSISLTNQSVVQWDGKNFGGDDAATGTYFYQLILDNKVCKSGTMILLK